MPKPIGPLGRYIDAQRQKRGMSWRRVAYFAGLSPEAVSTAVSREGKNTPRLETLCGIAKALDVPSETLLQLAGMLPPTPEGKPSPEVKRLIDQILDVYLDVKDDPEAVKLLINLVSTSAETVRALAQHESQEQPA